MFARCLGRLAIDCVRVLCVVLVCLVKAKRERALSREPSLACVDVAKVLGARSVVLFLATCATVAMSCSPGRLASGAASYAPGEFELSARSYVGRPTDGDGVMLATGVGFEAPLPREGWFVASDGFVSWAQSADASIRLLASFYYRWPCVSLGAEGGGAWMNQMGVSTAPRLSAFLGPSISVGCGLGPMVSISLGLALGRWRAATSPNTAARMNVRLPWYESSRFVHSIGFRYEHQPGFRFWVEGSIEFGFLSSLGFDGVAVEVLAALPSELVVWWGIGLAWRRGW